MATKDISDVQVVQAYAEMRRQMVEAHGTNRKFEYADQVLVRTTGQPEKVCTRAMERAENNGLLDCGMWLRGGWLTPDGIALLESAGGVWIEF